MLGLNNGFILGNISDNNNNNRRFGSIISNIPPGLSCRSIFKLKVRGSGGSFGPPDSKAVVAKPIYRQKVGGSRGPSHSTSRNSQAHTQTKGWEAPAACAARWRYALTCRTGRHATLVSNYRPRLAGPGRSTRPLRAAWLWWMGRRVRLHAKV